MYLIFGDKFMVNRSKMELRGMQIVDQCITNPLQCNGALK